MQNSGINKAYDFYYKKYNLIIFATARFEVFSDIYPVIDGTDRSSMGKLGVLCTIKCVSSLVSTQVVFKKTYLRWCKTVLTSKFIHY